MDQLNDLSFERLELIHEYILLSKQLESCLTSARLNFTKARTLHGVTLTKLADPDAADLVAMIRIDDSNGYKIIESEDATESRKMKKDDTSEKKSSNDERKKDEAAATSHIFRPFGVLEPMVAKEGRKTMQSALNIICEMATVQRAIKKTEEEMERTIKTIDIECVIERLKI